MWAKATVLKYPAIMPMNKSMSVQRHRQRVLATPFRRWWLGSWLLPLTMAAMGVPGRAIAHGVAIDYRPTPALAVRATYDSGEPMANAQVAVYSPENLSEPWLTGMTDEQGQFTFIPDPDIAGSWDVQVRQAGHGDIISIPLQELDGSRVQMANAWGPSARFSPLQKGVMAASVIWGLVGTALFFTGRAKKNAHS